MPRGIYPRNNQSQTALNHAAEAMLQYSRIRIKDIAKQLQVETDILLKESNIRITKAEKLKKAEMTLLGEY